MLKPTHTFCIDPTLIYIIDTYHYINEIHKADSHCLTHWPLEKASQIKNAIFRYGWWVTIKMHCDIIFCGDKTILNQIMACCHQAKSPRGQCANRTEEYMYHSFHVKIARHDRDLHYLSLIFLIKIWLRLMVQLVTKGEMTSAVFSCFDWIVI